jgi:hypothetical protein
MMAAVVQKFQRAKIALVLLACSCTPAPTRSDASVAVCVAGHLRALAHGALRENWRHTLLEPIRPDVFLQVSGQSSLKRSIAKGKNGLRMAVDPRHMPGGYVGLALSLEQVNATLSWFEDYARTTGRLYHAHVSNDGDVLKVTKAMRALGERKLIELEGDGTLACPQRASNRVRPQLRARWARCDAEIRRAERARGHAYDAVMLLRPDMAFPCSFPAASEIATPVPTRMLAFDDYWWLTSRDVGLAVLGNSGGWGPASKKCVGGCNMRARCLMEQTTEMNATVHEVCPMATLHCPECPRCVSFPIVRFAPGPRRTCDKRAPKASASAGMEAVAMNRTASAAACREPFRSYQPCVADHELSRGRPSLGFPELNCWAEHADKVTGFLPSCLEPHVLPNLAYVLAPARREELAPDRGQG